MGGDFFKECQSIVSVMGKIMAGLKFLLLLLFFGSWFSPEFIPTGKSHNKSLKTLSQKSQADQHPTSPDTS